MKDLRDVPGRAAILLIRAYQSMVSPLLGPRCRFFPSCSEYCRQAISQRGLWGGAWLGLRRLARCHPWHGGGFDPVPAMGGAVSRPEVAGGCECGDPDSPGQRML